MKSLVHPGRAAFTIFRVLRSAGIRAASGRWVGWTAKVLFGLFVGLLLRSIFAAESFASHPHFVDSANRHLHLKTMTNFDNDDFCVDVTASSMSYADAYSKVAGTLYIDD